MKTVIEVNESLFVQLRQLARERSLPVDRIITQALQNEVRAAASAADRETASPGLLPQRGVQVSSEDVYRLLEDDLYG
jgi:hypothetical protein